MEQFTRKKKENYGSEMKGNEKLGTGLHGFEAVFMTVSKAHC